jgi:hypothetical protein
MRKSADFMDRGAAVCFAVEPLQKNISDDMSNAFLIHESGIQNQMAFARDFVMEADPRVEGVGVVRFLVGHPGRTKHHVAALA